MQHNTEVLILGGGPSAAYAFQACKDYGTKADVYANEFTHPAGAFWLHWVPEEAWKAGKAFMYKAISIPLGTDAGYAMKMWGDQNIQTSFPSRGEVTEDVWDPLFLQHYFWQGCDPMTREEKFTDDGIQRIATFYPLVLQTFPTDASKLIQPKPRWFPIISRRTMFTRELLCIYNGMRGTPWVRMTVGFNQISVEYPNNESLTEDLAQDRGHNWEIQSYPDMVPETQPMATGIADNVILLGRAATWDRKALSHQAYIRTLQALNDFGVKKV